MSDKKYFWCETCILRLQGYAMGEAEWIQHINANPLHVRSLDEDDEEKIDGIGTVYKHAICKCPVFKKVGTSSAWGEICSCGGIRNEEEYINKYNSQKVFTKEEKEKMAKDQFNKRDEEIEHKETLK